MGSLNNICSVKPSNLSGEKTPCHYSWGSCRGCVSGGEIVGDENSSVTRDKGQNTSRVVPT